MVDISVQNIVKAFEEDNNVLDGLSFEVYEGEHIALIGKNGAGKTTLFRILSGEIEADEGQIVLASGKRVGLLSQIPHFPAEFTGEDVLKTAHARVYKLQDEMRKLEQEMETASSGDALARYDKVYNEFMNCGGYELERFRNTVANGLMIPKRQRDQLFESLSGGEKTRLNLARLILENTDILLLDEPTNHLDMRAAEWLEEYVSKFKGTVIIISHDRYFLDKTVTRTIEIVRGKAEFYSGNYSFYVIEKQARYIEQLKKYERDQATLKRLEEAKLRLENWSAGSRKRVKMASAVRSIQSRIDRLEVTARPDYEKKLWARFSENDFNGDEVVSAKGVSKHYGDKTLFLDVEFLITGGERVALIGDNGTGKSTLLKIIMQEERADNGFVKRGPAVKIAYLPQIIQFKHPEQTVLETVLEYDRSYTPQSARNRLGAFKFTGEDVFRPVSQLSGGEQSRLRLCMLMKEDINLLILDEPTNHLDIASREWIEEAIDDYGEAMIFVSHDRYFIDKFATRIWELRDGKIYDFRGTFAQYTAIKEAQQQQMQIEAKQVREVKPKKANHKSTTKQIAQIERDIASLEIQLAQIEQEIELFSTDYEKLMEIDVRRSAISQELEEKYAQWEELAQ